VRTSAEAIYLDSSALVKLVVHERESEALTRFLEPRPIRASSLLARVEVVRAVRALGPNQIARARALLDDVRLVRLDDDLLDVAAEINGASLRSLDAIHLASALALRPALSALITYDHRMAAAAQGLGITVVAPSPTGL
jgi:hypothetical protein